MSFETRDGMSRDGLGMVTGDSIFQRVETWYSKSRHERYGTRRQSRGVVHDLRAKAAAAKYAIVPVAKKEQKQSSPQKKPPLRPKQVQIEEEKQNGTDDDTTSTSRSTQLREKGREVESVRTRTSSYF